MLNFTSNPSSLNLVLYTSRVSAGFPSPADDHIEGKLDLNLHLVRRQASTFFIRAEGESMKNIGIFSGDLMIVDRSISPQPNDIVIAVVNGELTVKRLNFKNNIWILSAEHSYFPDIHLNDNDCEVWGVVTHNIRQHCTR